MLLIIIFVMLRTTARCQLVFTLLRQQYIYIYIHKSTGLCIEKFFSVFNFPHRIVSPLRRFYPWFYGLRDDRERKGKERERERK